MSAPFRAQPLRIGADQCWRVVKRDIRHGTVEFLASFHRARGSRRTRSRRKTAFLWTGNPDVALRLDLRTAVSLTQDYTRRFRAHRGFAVMVDEAPRPVIREAA